VNLGHDDMLHHNAISPVFSTAGMLKEFALAILRIGFPFFCKFNHVHLLLQPYFGTGDWFAVEAAASRSFQGHAGAAYVITIYTNCITGALR
jgi:hypothetical protein